MAYDETKVVNVKALKDTATRIKTEYLAAISKAGHARLPRSPIPCLTLARLRKTCCTSSTTMRPAITTCTP